MFCEKCWGRIFIDRAFSHDGDIELSCTKCGKHWELHRTHKLAIFFTRIERTRQLGSYAQIFLHQ